MTRVRSSRACPNFFVTNGPSRCKLEMQLFVLVPPFPSWKPWHFGVCVDRLSKSAIAILAALGVCVVLITPALDELPTTLPHVVHHAIATPVMGGSVVVQTRDFFHQPSILVAPLTRSSDLLSLMCTRLC